MKIGPFSLRPAMAALAVALGGLPGCLPSESGDEPTVLGTGDAGTGAGGQGAGGQGGGGLPWGTGGQAQPGGDPGSGGQAQPGGDPGTGGMQSCEPDCRGRVCGPDGCGGTCGRGCGDGEVCSDGQCSSEGCPADLIVRPGEHRGGPLAADGAIAYTIEVDGPQRIRARVRFDDGSCPGFDSPFDTANEFITLGVATVDELGNRPMIGRGREGLGLGEDCIVSDAQVTVGGAYEVILGTRLNLPAHTLTIEVLPPAPARNGAQTIDRTGVYAKAIPEDGRASFPLRIATPQHVIILAAANEVNNGYPEGCLFGEIGLEIRDNNYVDMDDTHCPVIEAVLPAGDYTLHADRTFGDADRSYRAVVFMAPVGGPAAVALPEFAIQVDGAGGGNGGGDVIEFAGEYERGAIPQGGSDRMTLRLAARRDVTLQTGDGRGGCPADTTLTLNQNGAQVGFDDDGIGRCSSLSMSLAAGDYEIVVRGYDGAAVPAYVLTASF